MISKKIANDYNAFADKWYEAKKNKQINPLHDFINIPAMHRLLPNLKGKSVLCIGCGTGEECEYLKSKGAKRVVGIDLSKNMIKFARTAHRGIEFQVMSIEDLDFKDSSFDFVYASLVLHYLKDWKKSLAEVRRVMKKNGRFVFSVHHPIKWSAWVKKDKDASISLIGYIDDRLNGKCSVYGDYFSTRLIHDRWSGRPSVNYYKSMKPKVLRENSFDVHYYNMPISMMFRQIMNSGFKLLDMQEPRPLLKERKSHPTYWERASKIPYLIIFELQK